MEEMGIDVTQRYQTINDIEPVVIIEPDDPDEEGDILSVSYRPPKTQLPQGIITPFCGNGDCEPEYGENCVSYPQDCWPCCGDGSCRGGESCCDCPEDCGECDPSPTPSPTTTPPPPTTPPPDPCPCADDLDVKKLLNDIELQKEMMQAEIEFMDENIKEYEEEKRKYEEQAERWAKNFNKHFSPDSLEWWISTLGGPIVSAFNWLRGKDVTVKDTIENTLLVKALTLDSFTVLYAYNKMRANDIEMQINKHIGFLHYHGDLCEGYTKELLRRCPCALEGEEQS